MYGVASVDQPSQTSRLTSNIYPPQYIGFVTLVHFSLRHVDDDYDNDAIFNIWSMSNTLVNLCLTYDSESNDANKYSFEMVQEEGIT